MNFIGAKLEACWRRGPNHRIGIDPHRHLVLESACESFASSVLTHTTWARADV